MKLLDTIRSTQDQTIKFVFLTAEELVLEAAYINKNDGKDIICVPCQSACRMKCKFCHVTDVTDKLICRNFSATAILTAVGKVIGELDLPQYQRPLLISYMGCGEPLLNPEVVPSMIGIRDLFKHQFPLIRYAVATSMPRVAGASFFIMTHQAAAAVLPLKIHLSLHHTVDELRNHWMPNAMNIRASIAALEYYGRATGNSTEVHYAMLDGVNDWREDAERLADLLAGRNIPVKLLFYNEKPTMPWRTSVKEKVDLFGSYLGQRGIKYEYYIPPGLDVGASCGQFLMDYYLKYNIKVLQ